MVEQQTIKRRAGRPKGAKGKISVGAISDQIERIGEDMDTWSSQILHDLRNLSGYVVELGKPVQAAKAFTAKMNGEEWRPHFAEKKEKVPKEILKGKYLKIEVLLKNGDHFTKHVPYETNLTWAKYGDRTIVAWRPSSGTEE